MGDIQVAYCQKGTLMREGAGVKLRRYIGADRKNDCEPILLLDYFDSDNPMDYMGGFPSHPHRGFETVTYLLHGKMKHQDNQGHEGTIGPGDVQWMTAGRGLLHSEMPAQLEGRLTGIQLWLNLPHARKFIPPAYQEFTHEDFFIEHHENGAQVKVIAGKTNKGTCSPLRDIATDPLFFDIKLLPFQQFEQTILTTHQAIILILSGELMIQNQLIPAESLAVLSAGDLLTLQTEASGVHCLLIAAKKLHEPIARLGPFVMCTDDEIAQAMDDLRNNRF